ncbi:uncharacterized protein LOC136096085 [Hydra vulgaris]|uniref:uncharacterized protein LOC136096085 n=1 Tax=Hydra vulgaris TaxID=6087 RepID=UPI0032EA75F0
MADLISISRTFDYHVIAISETWFRNDSVPNIDGYSLYRKDRQDGRRGGGVAIYITDVFNSHEVNQFYTNLLEQVWVSVKFNNKHILIGCIYRPNDASLIKYVAESFKLAHSLIKKPYDDCLIVGDFNFPNIKWSNDGIESFNPNNPTEYDFWNIFRNSLFTQHITFPTFQTDYGSSNNMLDLLFTYNSNSILNLSPSIILGNTTKGHFSITWRFLVSELFTESKSQSFNYKKGDYDSISNFIASIDWEFLFLHKTADQMFNILISNYRTACTYFIPKINKTKKKYDPWVTPHIKNLIREKKSAWHINCFAKWENSELKIKYNRLNRSVKTEIFKAKKAHEKEIISKSQNNPKIVYKYINKQLKIKDRIRSLKDTSGRIIEALPDIVDLLNSQFKSMFTLESSEIFPLLNKSGILSECIYNENLDFSISDIIQELADLKPYKSFGSDGLHPLILKICAKSFAIPLTKIFHKSFNSGINISDMIHTIYDDKNHRTQIQ